MAIAYLSKCDAFEAVDTKRCTFDIIRSNTIFRAKLWSSKVATGMWLFMMRYGVILIGQ